jgi:hypothetical protein
MKDLDNLALRSMMCLIQALLEATAKGSYGARMPRQQQSTLGPASMARPGSHLPADVRARGHMLGSQHVRPILTGKSTLSCGINSAAASQCFITCHSVKLTCSCLSFGYRGQAGHSVVKRDVLHFDWVSLKQVRAGTLESCRSPAPAASACR